MTFGATSEAGGPHGSRGLGRPAGLAALAAGLTTLALALLLPGTARHADSDGEARLPAGAIPVAVSIDPHRPGRPVPRRFVGLSFEVAALAQLAAYANHGNLVTLLRSLGPGVLRFGGISADTRVAWTDRLTPRPAWASAVLHASDLRRLGRLAARSGWRVLLTVGLAHYDPRAAAREAAAAKAALGSALAGIEVGNEPDAYAKHGLRTLPWGYRQYNAEVGRYRRAISRAAPGIPLAGPGVSGSRAFERWGPAEVRRQHPALLTGHHYPLGCHDTPPPTIDRLLSEHIAALENKSLARYMSVSHRSAIRLRVDEANTVSCGGKPGISDTFASALWAVGYIARTMAAGASGINLQGNPANCRGYSPLCAPTPARLAAGALSAQPEWYALLLTSALVGGRPLRTAVTSPQEQNVSVTALRGAGRMLQLVIVDGEPAGSSPAALSVHVGRSYRTSSVLALSAPAPDAVGGVRLGGRAVASDGSWRAPARPAQLPVRRGVLALTVAPASAALVTVTRTRARHGR
jgi:hypothetical protein